MGGFSMKKKKVFRLVSYLCLFLLVLSACSSGETSSSDSGGEIKDLVVAVTGEAKSLDPHNTTDSASKSIYSVMAETLVSLEENGDISPLLAKSWEKSEDGKTWTFQLQEGVKFTDGEPFNAEAVKTSFDRVTNEENKLARYPLLGPFIESITANGENEVVFQLKEPVGPFLNILAFASGSNIISPKSIEAGEESIKTNPIGTGPYKLKNWSPGSDTVFEANKDYWGDAPKVDTITFRYIPETASRVIMLETGEVDVINNAPDNDVDRLNDSEGIKVLSKNINRTVYVGINTSVAPLDQIEIRQAFNYAVDKDALANSLYGGWVKESTSAVSESTQMYSNAGSYGFDLEKAKELVKKAGVKEGTKLRLIAAGNVTRDHKAAEYVQASLQKIGFDVELQLLELSDYLATLEDPTKYELFLRGGIAHTNDANDLLQDALQSTSAFNYAHYANPEVDRLITEGAIESDEDKRQKIYEESLNIIKEEAPWIFLYEDVVHVGMRDNVEGLIIPPNNLWNYSKIDK